ncbi:MAG: hypothetical protein GY810_26470 [Aureispira sp.]|nr:hypothetical protein [Aureispira sp.]
MLQITPNYLGGKQGIQNILNNYYEQQIKKISNSSRQLTARKLIEEGLIVDGARVSLAESIVSNNFQVKGELLQQLLETRLIRVETTHLGRAYEVSHDTLVDPILASYERRRAKELQAEREKALILEQQQRELELEKARAKFRRVLLLAIVGIILFLGAMIALWFANQKKNEAIEAKLRAKTAEIEAKNAEDRAIKIAIENKKKADSLTLQEQIIKDQFDDLSKVLKAKTQAELGRKEALDHLEIALKLEKKSSENAKSRALSAEALLVQDKNITRAMRLAEASLQHDAQKRHFQN